MLVIWPKWFGFFVVSLMFASVTVGVSGAVTAGSETFGFAKFGVLNILKVCAAKSRFNRSCRTKDFEIPRSRCRKCGPKYCMKPSFPSAPFACEAKAPGLKNASLDGLDR